MQQPPHASRPLGQPTPQQPPHISRVLPPDVAAIRRPGQPISRPVARQAPSRPLVDQPVNRPLGRQAPSRPLEDLPTSRIVVDPALRRVSHPTPNRGPDLSRNQPQSAQVRRGSGVGRTIAVVAIILVIILAVVGLVLESGYILKFLHPRAVVTSSLVMLDVAQKNPWM